MIRQKSFRSFLTICCSFALLLYIAAPLFVHAQTQTQPNQPPSTQENRTVHEPPSAGGTTNSKSHKSKKTKKSHQDKTNARQKPGTSTGTNPGMNQGTSPDMNRGKMQQPDTYGQNPNSGGAGVNPDKSPR